MRPLYEITADLAGLNDLLESVEGDLSRFGEGEAAVTAFLDSLGSEQAEKIDHYLSLVSQLQMEAAAAAAEIEQWQERCKRRAARSVLLLSRLKDHMEATGQRRIETASGKVVAVVANGGPLKMVLKDEVVMEDVPDTLTRTRREIDPTKVREALEKGETVPFAHLATRGSHIRIR